MSKTVYSNLNLLYLCTRKLSSKEIRSGMWNDVTRLSKSHSKFQALIKLAAGVGTPGLTGD